MSSSHPMSESLDGSQVRVAVAGVSGYAGAELTRLLLRHPALRSQSPLLLSRRNEDADSQSVALSEIHHQLAGPKSRNSEVYPFCWKRIEDYGANLLFLATPHQQSREWVPEALARKLKVIDLSGAWRLNEEANRDVYNLVDNSPEVAESIQREAVYGCPELHREIVKTARIVANPGCYATSIILALAPLIRAGVVDVDHGIVCDAKSGVSGAGKAATSKTHFMYAADNLSAYSVFGHRHTGEMTEQLCLSPDQIQFTPHLLPIPRGILSTIYLRLRESSPPAGISNLYNAFYETSPLVRLHHHPSLPQIQYVATTNFCDIGFSMHSDGVRMVIVSCLDNLLKGAAGQAVQNMNIMYGWDEAEGLL